MTFDKDYITQELARRDEVIRRLEREVAILRRRVAELETEAHRAKYQPKVLGLDPWRMPGPLGPQISGGVRDESLRVLW